MAVKKQAARISLDEFTTVTYDAVLRAVEARTPGGKRPSFGPIVFGFIWWPDGPGSPPTIGGPSNQ